MAFVLNDGESLRDAVPPHYRSLFDRLSAESADASVMIPFPIWRETFMNDADLELATACYGQLSAFPWLKPKIPCYVSTREVP